MAKPRGYTRHRPISDARAKAWTSMRILQCFTLPQLQITAEGTEGNLFVFVRRLVRAGYLRIAKEREINRPGSRTVYQLVRNTGPLRPIPQRSGVVYDPNIREVFGQPRGVPGGNAIMIADTRSEESRSVTTNTGLPTSDRDRATESEARRAARRIGLVANKARGRRGDYNRGGFALIDPVVGRIIVGKRFDLTTENVIEHCRSVESKIDRSNLNRTRQHGALI